MSFSIMLHILVRHKVKYLLLIYWIGVQLTTTTAQCWEWQNPSPNGNHYNDQDFFNQTLGYRVASAGLVEKTTDGGSSWQEINLGIGATLRAVQLIDENTVFIVGHKDYASFIFKTTDGGASWTRKTLTYQGLYGIHFIDSLRGFVVGENSDAIILSTQDGGETWVSTEIKNASGQLNDVFFVDQNAGWAVGRNLVLKTLDGGQSWQRLEALNNGIYNAVSFNTENTGWIVGRDITLKTIDAGQNWEVQDSNYTFYDIFFLDENIGWFSGSYGRVRKTVDGGNSWFFRSTPRRIWGLLSIHFVNENKGWAIGSNGTQYETQNGGEQWQGISDNFGDITCTYSLSFIDENRGWASGSDGRILKTQNGGDTWEERVVLTDKHSYKSIAFVNENYGIATGQVYRSDYSGVIIKTRDGGQTWDYVYTDTTILFEKVFLANDSIGWVIGNETIIDSLGWLVGSQGTLLKTVDGGETWLARDSTIPERLADIFFLDENKGWIVGSNGTILKSIDGGETWESKAIPDFNASIRSCHFLDNNRDGWITIGSFVYAENEAGERWGTSAGGKVFKTTDGGDSWVEIGEFLEGAIDVHFLDANRGWVAGQYGSVFSTLDGGVTWTKQRLRTTSQMLGFHVWDENNLWITGCWDDILKYEPVTPRCDSYIMHPKTGDTDVSRNTTITWSESMGCPDGYLINIGSSPGANDIVANQDVKDNAFCPSDPLPANTKIYVSLTPYNRNGTGNACSDFSFTTGELNCRPTDSLTLISIYEATDGSNWTEKWDFSQPIMDWHGVKLNPSGCVSELNLKDNNLVGSLPLEIGQLSFLEELDLSENRLSGNLPTEISALQNLKRLNLDENQFSGSIPPEIGNLKNLESLLLSVNDFSGGIPIELWSLTQLKSLALFRNDLEGSISPEIGNLINLTDLRLYSNNFSGNIPEEIGSLKCLENFWGYNNDFSGSLPASIGNLENLRILHLSNNVLTGTIPDSFSQLGQIRVLDLRFNQLVGNIPLSLFVFGIDLDLAYNNFSSMDDVSSIETRIDELYLQGNNLTFSDLLPAVANDNISDLLFIPQDSVFVDTTITTSVGSDLSVDLGFDSAVPDNVYTWYKNGEPYQVLGGYNKLTFEAISIEDAGSYNVKVTNPRIPDLSLRGRSIEVIVESNTSTLELSMESIAGSYNNPICIPVMSNGLENLSSLQINFEFDANLLSFRDVGQVHLPGLSAQNFQPTPTGVTLDWNQLQGTSVAAGEILFELCFDPAPQSFTTTVNVGTAEAGQIVDEVALAVEITANSATVSTFAPIRLIAGEVEGKPGDLVRLPIMIENGGGLAALQAKITFASPALLEVIGMEDEDAETFFNPANGNFLFFDAAGEGLNLAPLDTLFYINIRLLGPGNTSSLVNFSEGDAFPLAAHLFDTSTNQLVEVEVNIQTGLVSLLGNVQLSGQILKYNDTPVEGASITANIIESNGLQSAITTFTDATGTYQFEEIPIGASVEIKPVLGESELEGLNRSRDLQAFQDLLENQPNPDLIVSPMQMVAADVNCDGVFSVEDLSIVQQSLVALRQDFSPCLPWVFVPTTILPDFSIQANYHPNFPFAQSVTIEAIEEDALVDFIGVQKGDLILEEGESPIQLRDNVKVVPRVVDSLLIERTETFLVFNGNHPFLSGIRVGDVMVSDVENELVPQGYLRRVLQVEERAEGGFIFFTEFASIIDLLFDGKIDTSVELLNELREFNEVIFDQDENPNTENDQVSIIGSLQLGATIERLLICALDGNSEASIQPKISFEQELRCEIGLVDFEEEISKEIYQKKFRPIKVRVPYLPVPIVVTPIIEVEAGLTAAAEASITLGERANGNFKLQVDYKENEGISYNSESGLAFESLFSYDGSISTEVFLKPKLSLEIYEGVLATLDLNTKLYLKGEVGIGQSSTCQLLGGLEAGVAGALHIFDLPFEKEKVIDYSEVLDDCSGNESIYSGDVFLRTQADVDSFGGLNYTKIAGDLGIGGSAGNLSDITDLSPLQSLEVVTGSFSANYNERLESFAGLSSLEAIEKGVLSISFNDQLKSLSGLPSMKTFAGNTTLGPNAMLEDFSGLESLETVQGDLTIQLNPVLKTLKGLSNLASVEGDLSFNANSLEHIDALTSLTSVGGDVNFVGNTSILHVNGFENLIAIGGSAKFESNFNLSDFCGLTKLFENNGLVGTFTTAGNGIVNPFNPTREDMLAGNCRP